MLRRSVLNANAARSFGTLLLRPSTGGRLAHRSLTTLALRPSPFLSRRAPNHILRRAESTSTADEARYGALPPNATMSERVKHLMKKYGWYALGVYLAVSVVDFSIVFATINLLGADKVSHAAAVAKNYVLSFVRTAPPPVEREVREDADEVQDQVENVSKGGREGLYAMIVLAYTIHKTLFLPVRVGVTAAVTPKLVGWLRMRGWVGKDGARRAATVARKAATDMRERVKQKKE